MYCPIGNNIIYRAMGCSLQMYVFLTCQLYNCNTFKSITTERMTMQAMRIAVIVLLYAKVAIRVMLWELDICDDYI